MAQTGPTVPKKALGQRVSGNVEACKIKNITPMVYSECVLKVGDSGHPVIRPERRLV